MKDSELAGLLREARDWAHMIAHDERVCGWVHREDYGLYCLLADCPVDFAAALASLDAEQVTCDKCGRKLIPNTGHVCVPTAEPVTIATYNPDPPEIVEEVLDRLKEPARESDTLQEHGTHSDAMMYWHERAMSAEERLARAEQRAEMLNGFREEEYKLRMKVQDALEAEQRQCDALRVICEERFQSMTEQYKRADRAERERNEARAEADIHRKN